MFKAKAIVWKLLLIAAAIQFVAAIGFAMSPRPKIQNGEPTPK